MIEKMNYLIIGDDEYIKENEIEKIKNKFLSPSETELNYSIYTPENIEDIMDSLETMPFLAKKRVAVIKETERLPAEFIDVITSYLENPSNTSVLVLSSDGSLKNKKYYQKIVSLVKIVKADKPTTSTIRNWIYNFFRKQKIEISHEAVELIVELKGTDTIKVKTELDKLVCFSNGDKIEAWHVEQLVGRSVTEMIFKLVDAINIHDAKWVFRILNDLYDQKKQPSEIIGYLNWYTKITQKLILLSARGVTLSGIAAELGYSPAYVRKLLAQAKKYSIARINNWLALLFETDREIKTGLKQPFIAIEMLMASLLRI